MRPFIVMIVMIATTAASAKKMHVVIHARDRVVVTYACENGRGDVESSIFRSEIRAQGRFTYRGVGGVAPYTYIGTERIGDMICITLMDATGTMATGCGMQRVVTYLELVPCPNGEFEPEVPVTLVPENSARKPKEKEKTKAPAPREREPAREDRHRGVRDRPPFEERPERRSRMGDGPVARPDRNDRVRRDERGHSGGTTTTRPGGAVQQPRSGNSNSGHSGGSIHRR